MTFFAALEQKKKAGEMTISRVDQPGLFCFSWAGRNFVKYLIIYLPPGTLQIEWTKDGAKLLVTAILILLLFMPQPEDEYFDRIQ